MFNNSEFPYFNSQQLNLDWLLSTVAEIKNTMIPQINIDILVDDSDDGLINTLNRNNNKIPLGASVIHVGRYVDEAQLFIFFGRANENIGYGYVMFNFSNNISIGNIGLYNGEFYAD